MFQSGNGDRCNVPNYLVIVTDGNSDNATSTWQQAMRARAQGINIITVSNAARSCSVNNTLSPYNTTIQYKTAIQYAAYNKPTAHYNSNFIVSFHSSVQTEMSSACA